MKTVRITNNRIFIAAGLLWSFTTAAYATPITGVLNISGGVSVSMTTIDFLPLAVGTGSISADAFTNSGSFAVLNTGNPGAPAQGTIKDLIGGPLVGPFSVPFFLSGFALAPNIELDLTAINPGIFSSAKCSTNVALAAPGNVCSPVNSPFNLSDVSSGAGISAVISLGLSGVAVNTTTGEKSAFTGVLTTQMSGVSYESILGTLNSGGAIATSYSGSFTATAVPEPAAVTMLFAGFGMVGVGLLGRRFRGARR